MSDDVLNQEMERDLDENFFEDFAAEVEAEIGNLEMEDQACEMPIAEGGDSQDSGYLQMLDTFMEIMQDSLKPVTRYMKAIKIGLENHDIFEVIWLTTAPFLEKVQQVGLLEPAAKIEDFVDAVEKIIHAKEVLQRMRVEFFMTYAILQDTFKLEFRGNRLAIQNLLDFYRIVKEDPVISDSDIGKFFAIGVPSLTWVRKTQIKEIQSLSGMSGKSITRMKSIIRNFRREKAIYYANKRKLSKNQQLSARSLQAAANA